MKTRRIIIVTGSSRGIGHDVAAHFLARGDIVHGCSRGPVTSANRRYRHHALDVGDEAAVVAMIREVVARDGRIDALINNAGIASMNHALLTPAKVAEDIFSTNFQGTFLFCREAAKAMLRRKTGRIVNFTSIAHPLRLEGESLYGASKAAVESFTQILARELGPTGITVNAVGPSPVPTDMVRNVPRRKMDALLSRQAIPRFGTSADVVNVVEFFLSPSSEFVTGQVIYLGGVSG